MLRLLERKFNELREIKFTRNYTCYAEGSVFVEFGNTKVLCNASIIDEVPSFLKGKNQGWLSAEYAMLPRATHSRSNREIYKTIPRNQEIQRLIARSLRAIIDLNKLGERKIILDCDVIQADGGTRTASISGAYIALVDAVNHLLMTEKILTNPLRSSVAAVSVGKVGADVLLDLDYREDSSCEYDVNIVMNGELQLVEIQGTAEGATFSRTELNQILDLAETGIKKITQLQLECLLN